MTYVREMDWLQKACSKSSAWVVLGLSNGTWISLVGRIGADMLCLEVGCRELGPSTAPGILGPLTLRVQAGTGNDWGMVLRVGRTGSTTHYLSQKSRSFGKG